MATPSLPVWLFLLATALAFGSFLNVCISRLPQHRSVVWPGSACPRCGASIRAFDNLPVVSWLLLRGRCRACRGRIAPRYPLVEAGYALLVFACVARSGLTLEALAGAAFCFLALGLLVMDLETMLLPDSFTIPGLLLGLGWAFASGLAGRPSPTAAGGRAALSSALSAGGWVLGLLLIRGIYFAVRHRQGLGLGDVKLVAMLAAWMGGLRMAVCFVIAVTAAAAWAALLIVSAPRQGRDWRTRRLPFGAFLCAGGLCAYFFGDQILAWYLRFYI